MLIETELLKINVNLIKNEKSMILYKSKEINLETKFYSTNL